MNKEEIAAQRKLKQQVKELSRVISDKDRQIAILRHNVGCYLPPHKAVLVCSGIRIKPKEER